MKRITLSAHDAAWLAHRFSVNRNRFAGWRMEDDPAKAAADKAAADKVAADAAAAEKAAAEKAAAEKAAKDKETDLGFPADTPVKEMTVDQRAAYYEHKARKHEERNKDLLKITGGKHGDDLKGDLDELAKLRKASLTDGEKAVDEAKSTTRAETVKDVGAKGARAVLEVALGHHPEDNDQSDVIDTLDLTKLVNDDGSIDTDKVRKLVEKIAPADKGAGGRHDHGGGRRTQQVGSGVGAGRSRYKERHGKSDKDD